MRQPFKQCTECGHAWAMREDMLGDPLVSVSGYQPDFRHPDAGLILFNHACGTTLSVKVEVFRDLYAGPVFTRALQESAECPGHCMRPGDLSACRAQCECAYVREILQIIVHWPKDAEPKPTAA